jgi:hypothetical protein
MAITDEHAAAERAFRELLPEAGLPQPDEVEYREESVVFLWHESKLAVIVELGGTGDGELGGTGDGELDGTGDGELVGSGDRESGRSADGASRRSAGALRRSADGASSGPAMPQGDDVRPP